MKNEFDDKTRNALIEYRLERSKETMKESNLLSDNGFYNAAVNRLYYACYYAVVALFLKNNITAQTHSGVKTSFGLNFVSTGKVPMSVGKTFATLFDKRQSGDYEDFIFCDKEDVDELTKKAEEFVSTITNLVKQG